MIPDKPDKLLADALLQSFNFAFAMRPYDMQVDISLRSFSLDDKMVLAGSQFPQLVTSDSQDVHDRPRDLVNIHYARVNPDSPDFMTVHEGNNQAC